MSSSPKNKKLSIPIEAPNQDEKDSEIIKNSSFFDDAKIKSKVFTQVKMTQAQLPKLIIYNKAFYFKKSRKSEKLKPIFLYLTENGIFWAKDSSPETIKKHMPFENTRVIIVKNEKPNERMKLVSDFPFGFKFYRNYSGYEIYTDNATIFNPWRSILMYKSIQHTFHEEFEVKKMIGKGSFAKVYYAIKKETGKEYAIKAFNKKNLLSQNFGKESLINEINIMKKLDHKHILQIYEVFETKHSIYLIIELLSGGELIKSVKEKNKLQHNDIALVMRNILDALDHMHSKKIMHRDLKPENILLRKKNEIYNIVIADFGLASFLNLPASAIFFKRCGTPGFVAPEILTYKEGQDNFYDEKCDIFSAGVIFYLLMTGKKLFQGSDYKEVLRENRDCDIDYSDPLLKDVPATAMDLLKKMLFVFPQGRLSAAKALTHKYFSDFIQEEAKNEDLPVIDMKFIQMNLNEYTNDFSPISPSKDNSGLSPLVTKKPVLNGRTDTLEKVTTGCFISSVGIDVSPRKNIGVSKFSQAYQDASQGEGEDNSGFGGAIGGGSPINMKNKGNNMVKKAIINNFNKESSVSPKKEPINFNDAIPDEKPNIKNDWESKKSGIHKKTTNFEKK